MNPVGNFGFVRAARDARTRTTRNRAASFLTKSKSLYLFLIALIPEIFLLSPGGKKRIIKYRVDQRINP